MIKATWHYPDVEGSGGGGGGGGKKGGGTPKEGPDTLFSNSTAHIIDLLSEGEIGGLYDGDRSIYFNEVALASGADTLTYNFKGAVVHVLNGLATQPAIPGFDDVGTSVPVAQDLLYNVYKTISFPNDGTFTAVDATIQADAFFKVSNKGDTGGTKVAFTIELSENGGAFKSVVTGQLSGKQTTEYDVDYRIRINDTNGITSIRIKRTTADSATLKITDVIKFKQYTKIVEHKLTYPNCAVVGTIIDAKQFGNQLPGRSYKIKGLKISVPHNYDPVTRLYNGTFTGALSATKQWTNNPTWVFYDLVSNDRYGLGQYFPSTLIDIPSLYTISKWCDAIDARPYYFKSAMYTHTSASALWQAASAGYTVVNSTVLGPDGTYAIARIYSGAAAVAKVQVCQTGLSMVAGASATFTVGVLGMNTTTSAALSIEGSVNQFGTNATSLAKITSGPGTIVQDTGGRFIVTGLSNTVITQVSITRQAAATETFTCHWYLKDAAANAASAGAMWFPQFDLAASMPFRLPQSGTTSEGGTTNDYHAVTGRHGVPDGIGGYEPRWVCNTVITNRGDAFNVLKECVSCFRGVLFWMDGKLWAQADQPRDPVKIVTNANVIDGTFTYSGESNRSRVSVINVGWNDPAIFYRRATEVYEDPALIRELGWKTADYGAFGCTSRSQARRLAKAVLYSQENESELVTYKASFDHLATGGDGPAGVAPGDLVIIADRERGNAVAGGRMLTVTPTSFTTLDTLPTGAGTCYIDHASNGLIEWVSCSFTGTTVTLLSTPTTPIAANDLYIVVSGGGTAETFRVLKISQSEANIFEIGAVRYNDAKFNAIYGTSNIEQGDIMRVPRAVTIAAPASLTLTESFIYGADGTMRTIVATWPVVTDAWLDGYVVSYSLDDDNWIVMPQTGGSTQVIPDASMGVYSVRVQARNRFGLLGPAVSGSITLGAVPLGLAVGSIANLALVGGGTTFNGVEAKFVWQVGSPTGTYLTDVGITNINTGAVDPYFRDCFVTIKKTDNTVLRTISVNDTHFEYSREMMFEDTAGAPVTSFKIDVQYRDIYNQVSAAQTLTITNGAPGVPTALSVASGALNNTVRWTNPTDTDLVYCEILAFTSNTVGSATVIGKTLTGTHVHGNLVAGATYYYWVRSVDTWGNVGTTTAAGSAVVASIGAYELIGQDNSLHPTEKIDIIREFNDLTNEKTVIDAQADVVGTSRATYDTAYTALNTYLTGLSPAYSDTTTVTTIVRATWNTKWSDVYTARETLLVSIDNNAYFNATGDNYATDWQFRKSGIPDWSVANASVTSSMPATSPSTNGLLSGNAVSLTVTVVPQPGGITLKQITPGRLISWGAWIAFTKISGVNSPILNMKVQWKDSSGTNVGSLITATTQTFAATAAGAFYEATALAPATAAQATLTLEVTTKGGWDVYITNYRVSSSQSGADVTAATVPSVAGSTNFQIAATSTGLITTTLPFTRQFSAFQGTTDVSDTTSWVLSGGYDALGLTVNNTGGSGVRGQITVGLNQITASTTASTGSGTAVLTATLPGGGVVISTLVFVKTKAAPAGAGGSGSTSASWTSLTGAPASTTSAVVSTELIVRSDSAGKIKIALDVLYSVPNTATPHSREVVFNVAYATTSGGTLTDIFADTVPSSTAAFYDTAPPATYNEGENILALTQYTPAGFAASTDYYFKVKGRRVLSGAAVSIDTVAISVQQV